MTKKISLAMALGFLVAGVLLFAASPLPSAASGSKSFQVRITSHGYSPARLTIHVGDIVSWNTPQGFQRTDLFPDPPTILTYPSPSLSGAAVAVDTSALGTAGATYTFTTPQRIVYKGAHGQHFTGLLIILPAVKASRAITNQPASASLTVTIVGQLKLPGFSPDSITVHTGDTVVWTNKDPDGATPHTVTSDTGAFDSGVSNPINPGASFQFTFATAGTFAYHCSFHPSMTGKIIVQDAAPAPVNPAPIAPAPVNPAPVNPAPIAPAPVNPAPIAPAPIIPAPTPLPSAGGGMPVQLVVALVGLIALLGLGGSLLRRLSKT